MSAVGAVMLELPGGKFELRADITALIRLEARFGKRFDAVITDYFARKLTITETADFVACLCVTQDEHHTGDAVTKATRDMQGVGALYRAVDRAIVNEMPPPKTEQQEGGGNAPEVPSATAS